VGSWLAGGRSPSLPTYQRLTYRRGFVSNARFGPDGQTILYSADWDGAPSRVFSTRPEGRESTALPLPSASLLSVSSRGELAVLLDPKVDYNLYNRRGTLAVVPLSGGSPREVLREVRWADWSPDGKDLAVVRQTGARLRLEYPPGRLRYESSAWIVSPRVSPGGDRIVFYEGLPFNGYSLTVLDSQNRKTVLGPLWPDWWSSPWSPDGDEVWFPAEIPGTQSAPIMASDLSGRRRLLERGPSSGDLNDVSADGRALITIFDQGEIARGLLSGQKAESRLVSRTDLRRSTFPPTAGCSSFGTASSRARRTSGSPRGTTRPRFDWATVWRTASRPTGRGCWRVNRASSWRSRPPPESQDL
jgi:Tol biopolymer transport system component